MTVLNPKCVGLEGSGIAYSGILVVVVVVVLLLGVLEEKVVESGRVASVHCRIEGTALLRTGLTAIVVKGWQFRLLPGLVKIWGRIIAGLVYRSHEISWSSVTEGCENSMNRDYCQAFHVACVFLDLVAGGMIAYPLTGLGFSLVGGKCRRLGDAKGINGGVILDPFCNSVLP